jgi:hypothetical protein
MAPAAGVLSQLQYRPVDMNTAVNAVVTVVQEKGFVPEKGGARSPIGSVIPKGQPSPKLRKVVETYSNFKSREPGMLFPDNNHHLTCTLLDAKGLKYVNEQFFNLQSLTLENCPDLKGFYLSKPLAQLKRLTLDNLPSCTGSSLSNFTDVGRLPALQHLIIRNCQLIDDFSLFYIAQLLRQELTHIEFVNLPRITAPGLDQIQCAIQSYSGRLPIRSIIITDPRLERSSADEGFKASYISLQAAVWVNGLGLVVPRVRRASLP